MADTYTTVLQLLKQETGNNNNNWGHLLNTQVIDRIEQAIAGVSTIAVTGGTTVLTDDQVRAPAFVITGASSRRGPRCSRSSTSPAAPSTFR